MKAAAHELGGLRQLLNVILEEWRARRTLNYQARIETNPVRAEELRAQARQAAETEKRLPLRTALSVMVDCRGRFGLGPESNPAPPVCFWGELSCLLPLSRPLRSMVVAGFVPRRFDVSLECWCSVFFMGNDCSPPSLN